MFVVFKEILTAEMLIKSLLAGSGIYTIQYADGSSSGSISQRAEGLNIYHQRILSETLFFD